MNMHLDILKSEYDKYLKESKGEAQLPFGAWRDRLAWAAIQDRKIREWQQKSEETLEKGIAYHTQLEKLSKVEHPMGVDLEDRCDATLNLVTDQMTWFDKYIEELLNMVKKEHGVVVANYNLVNGRVGEIPIIHESLIDTAVSEKLEKVLQEPYKPDAATRLKLATQIYTSLVGKGEGSATEETIIIKTYQILDKLIKANEIN